MAKTRSTGRVPVEKSLHVAVIGAGPSGIVPAKELLQEGHRVTVFEQRAALGGVFRFDKDPANSTVWESCRLTSSILVTSFSDYVHNCREAEQYEHRHFTRAEYIEYLESYARHFGISERIRFGG